MWIYDPRTNKHFMLKTRPLATSDRREFIDCYHPADRHVRQACERFKYFAYDNLVARDKEHVEAALASFRDVAAGLARWGWCGRSESWRQLSFGADSPLRSPFRAWKLELWQFHVLRLRRLLKNVEPAERVHKASGNRHDRCLCRAHLEPTSLRAAIR